MINYVFNAIVVTKEEKKRRYREFVRKGLKLKISSTFSLASIVSGHPNLFTTTVNRRNIYLFLSRLSFCIFVFPLVGRFFFLKFLIIKEAPAQKR